MFRTVAEDTTVGGVGLAAGDRVALHIAAANLSGDSARRRAAGLAFGNGPHICLGEWPARIVARELVAGIMSRIPAERLREAHVSWGFSDNVRVISALALD